jgi:hypothetical protein
MTERKELKRIEQEVLEFFALQPDSAGTVQEIAQYWLSDAKEEDVQAALTHLYELHVLYRYGSGATIKYFVANETLVRTLVQFLRHWAEE